MPFAKKWSAMMEFPVAGETLGDFTIECFEARDVAGGFGQHGYVLDLVLQGFGGQKGVRKALRGLVNARPTTFSAYGTPYQLWCGRPEIESLGDRRYAVTVRGAGVPIALEETLCRFLDHLAETGELSGDADKGDRAALVDAYLRCYRVDIERHVARYRRRLQRSGV